MLNICRQLSGYVAKELTEDGLKAQKVHIKIKNVNFEVFSRTKSLTSWTNETEKIFEAAKYLLMNEWEQSQRKLRLRLIG